MKNLRFTWDRSKSAENVKKHGVSFEEAQTVFYDEFAIEFYDDAHSEWEDRFLLLGLSSKLRLLMVCHCYRKSESEIRIISARKATKNESKHYRR
ncbi:MAG: BrnT family toxin [bacterium]